MMCKSTLLLECRNLSFSHQQKQILHSISLTFRKGEFVALLGKNGAGKSTLLSCLLGILPASVDRLELGGMSLKTVSRNAIARQVSYVPQEHDDMFPFSALDVVVMGRTAYLGQFGAPTEQDFRLAKEILEELYIIHLAERVYTSLSGGEKQLVLIARALVQTRSMIFLDEPTNHLDYRNRYQILESLKKQCIKHNSCVVACLHDPNYARTFADRVILLQDGKIVADGGAEAVMTDVAVSRLYGIALTGSNGVIEPCFGKEKFAGRVLLLVGTSGEGKTTTLQQLLANNTKKKIGGIICHGTWKNNRRYSAEVESLSTGEKTLFCKRKERTGDGRFVFYPKGQRLANKALEASCNSDVDCVVIDEVGPLEVADQGHAPNMAPLLSLENVKHIWAVRPSIVEHVCNKWMLSEPVIVSVSERDALDRIQEFLNES